MNEDFTPFELAVKLREKGLPQDVFIGYDEFGTLCIGDEHPIVCASPIISQVLKWLREEKKIVVSILPTGYNKETGLPGYYYVIYDVAEYFWNKYEYPQSFETWEECAICSIKYVLDNLI